MRGAAERYWREEAAERIAFNTVTMLGLVRVLSSAPIMAGRPLEAAERIAFNTVTMLGLVRVLSSAPIMAGRPLEAADAWSVLQTWLATDHIVRLHEPEGCRAKMADMVAAGLVTRALWTDAYLAAFAIAARVRLVTFDTDFTRFGGLDLLHLAS